MRCLLRSWKVKGLASSFFSVDVRKDRLTKQNLNATCLKNVENRKCHSFNISVGLLVVIGLVLAATIPGQQRFQWWPTNIPGIPVPLRSDHPNEQSAEATDTLDVTEINEFFLAFASAVLFSQRFFSSRGDVWKLRRFWMGLSRRVSHGMWSIKIRRQIHSEGSGTLSHGKRSQQKLEQCEITQGNHAKNAARVARSAQEKQNKDHVMFDPMSQSRCSRFSFTKGAVYIYGKSLYIILFHLHIQMLELLLQMRPQINKHALEWIKQDWHMRLAACVAWKTSIKQYGKTSSTKLRFRRACLTTFWNVAHPLCGPCLCMSVRTKRCCSLIGLPTLHDRGLTTPCVTYKDRSFAMVRSSNKDETSTPSKVVWTQKGNTTHDDKNRC